MASGTAPGAAPDLRRVQIFQVSTLYGAATLAAALDAGQFGPREDAHRLLLISHNAEIPETALRLETMTGYERIAARFDGTLDWNETIHPYHPAAWAPRPEEAPLWQRVLRTAWGLGTARVELIVESIQVNPAKALAAAFPESSVDVYADGLMSYGPTRSDLAQSIAIRIRRVLHLDLVPGLRPLLLSEYGVEPELVPDSAFRAVLAEIAEASVAEDVRNGAGDSPVARAIAAEPTALLLGQYLAALNLLTAEEEEELHIRMLRGAAAAGHRSVVFKPHPTAPVRYSQALDEEARALGVRLTVLDGPLLAETFYERCRPRLVVGCFSTAMLTAAVYYGIPIARVGTVEVLERLTPFENSNRIPLTVVDHLVADLEDGEEPAVPGAAPDSLAPLVRAVGYCMRHKSHPGLREEATRFLAEHHAEPGIAHHFTPLRLTQLGLPGASEPVVQEPAENLSRLRRGLARARRG
ncbi:polysialyltransferase family glycosyltransferase [Streptomyces sp. NBC_00094]|uniref:polysialyltransferase family glycosyltransferase n=1 Tax=Streptomyces sp. NBC_00094 TaxID=2903620 RepID=UPI0022584926|nr:polysialyltransferase family glycosyltransferase [Streptomyces sp. NBC_00094]MCX5393689.1 alpha-2,8-polysialyltransferase family protein [Streptomyces sp. NBC_00094]